MPRPRASPPPATLPGTNALPSAPRGRPRSASARRAVLAAAFAQLTDGGYPALTMEGVAARAGVAKTTVYRGWPDRAALAVDAFFDATQDALAFPDTGSAREDFRRQIQALAAVLRGPVGAAVGALAAAAPGEPAVAAALAERWLGPRQRWGVARVRRAQADGECAADLDVDAALAALYGPLYAPLLLGLGAPSRARVEAYLALVFDGIFIDPPR